MEKRTIIALILITLIFILSNQFIWKNNKPQNQPVATKDSTVTQKTVTQTDTINKSIPAKEIAALDTAIIKQENVEEDNNIILENNLVKYVFTNRGAVVKKIYLKKYKNIDKKSDVQLIPPTKTLFDLMVSFSNNTNVDFKNFIYNFHTIDYNKIEFSINTFAGTITKTFELQDNSYTLNMNINAPEGSKITAYTLDMTSGLNDTEEFEKMKNYDYKFESDVENQVHKIKLSKLMKNNVKFSGRVNWAAIKSKFFIISIIPDELVITKDVEGMVSQYQKDGKNLITPAMKLNVSNKDLTLSGKYTLYIGPIIYKNIQKFGVGLENTVELGPKWLRWISTFFLRILILINKVIPSWGIAIIIFSLLLKLALFPFTHKSFESASKMQKLQPKLKEVQKKYKHDPKLLQAETSKLYKEHGVNPFGGCLPLFIQLPILYALYPVLRYSIDLRQTAFLYIKDLSAPDPYYVLPLLMAVFMFVQQKLAAPAKKADTEMDEKEKAAASSQKMMMYFMPIFLFFIFKSLPAGLMLYWTVSNIISTIQQYYIRKKFAKLESMASEQ